MLKDTVKFLDYDDSNYLSHTEKFIVSEINSNIEEFIKSNSLNEFCKKHGFVSTNLTTLSKKLNFQSAKKMKMALFEKFYKIKSNFETNGNLFYSTKISKKYQVLLTEFINNQILELINIDWNIIDKLVKKINEVKTIYFLSSVEFNDSTLELLCFIKKIRYISIKSDLRIQFINGGVDQEDSNSLLIVSKVRNYLNDKEKDIINKFVKKDIDCFLFMPLKQLDLNLKGVHILTFGNMSQKTNSLSKISHYKLTHDFVFEILLRILMDNFKITDKEI